MKTGAGSHVIVAVHITDRIKHAIEVQQILTAYGAHIKTRIGLHETDGGASSPNGFVILEMVGDDDKRFGILEELNTVDGVEAKVLVFSH